MKKSILIFIDWFLPAYKAGGPVQSIANFVNQFKHEFEISVVTSDRDLGDKTSFSNIELNQWVQKDNYRVIYLMPTQQNSRVYRSFFQEKKYDIVYFNSLFSVPFTLKPLLIARKYSNKIILAPRGMLGKGALEIKATKKKLFLIFCKISGLFRNINWLATDITEKHEIIKNFGSSIKVNVAPNLTSKRIEGNFQREKIKGQLNLFFLSRISIKKNLLFVLDVLNKVSSEIKLKYNIIGPIDDYIYWKECESKIGLLNANIEIIYEGPIENEKLKYYLKNYHFLLLPTQHENYGHVIIESLQHGCPVIISQNTPWRNLQAKNQEPETKNQEENYNHQFSVGWDLPLENPEEFVKVIEYCAAMNQEEYSAMSQRAFEYAQKIVNDPEVIEANRKLFEI